MKSELQALNKRLKMLDVEIANCLEVVRQKGADKFVQRLLHEAEDLTSEKQEVERERDKLKTEIEFRRRACADDTLVVEALSNFEMLFKA